MSPSPRVQSFCTLCVCICVHFCVWAQGQWMCRRVGEYCLTHTRVQIDVAVSGCTRARPPPTPPSSPGYPSPEDRSEGLFRQTPRPTPAREQRDSGRGKFAQLFAWKDDPRGPPPVSQGRPFTACRRCLPNGMARSLQQVLVQVRPLFFQSRGPSHSTGAGGRGCHHFSPHSLEVAQGFFPASVLEES